MLRPGDYQVAEYKKAPVLEEKTGIGLAPVLEYRGRRPADLSFAQQFCQPAWKHQVGWVVVVSRAGTIAPSREDSASLG